MNAPTQALATREESREHSPVEKLKRQMTSKRDEFVGSLPSHISFEKFQRTIATAALTNATLLTCDRQSLLVSASKAAQDGLLPDGREAALVPFKVNKKVDGQWQSYWAVQYMPMVYGLRKKILQSGEVVSLETGVVYRAELEAGHFIFEVGLEPPIRHRPKLDLTDEQMHDDEIVAAYSIARLKNATGEPYWSVEVMRRAEINKVRETSQTGATRDKKGNPRTASGPWVDWFGEMAKKTVLRRHSKTLPMSGDILDAIERDDEELAAQGAAHLLEVEPEARVVLPSSEELDGEVSNEQVDQETGEVTEPARNASTGMTEVDEETARALDAQQTFMDIDGPIGEEAEAELPDGARVKLEQIQQGIDAAEDLTALRKVKTEWEKHASAYPDAIAAQVGEALRSKALKVPERKPEGAGK